MSLIVRFVLVLSLGFTSSRTVRAEDDAEFVFKDNEVTKELAVASQRARDVVLRALVDDDNARSIGFDDAAEVERATLSDPIIELRLEPSALRLTAARRGAGPDDAAALLRVSRRVVYIIYVDGHVRTAMVLQRDDARTWKVVEVGGSATARRRAAVAGKLLGDPSARLVLVPALKSEFLMYSDPETGNRRFLCLRARPELGLAAGVVLSDAQVLDALIPAALAIEPGDIAPS